MCLEKKKMCLEDKKVYFKNKNVYLEETMVYLEDSRMRTSHPQNIGGGADKKLSLEEQNGFLEDQKAPM